MAATVRNPGQVSQLERRAAAERLPITVSTMDLDVNGSVGDGVGRIVRELEPVDVLVNDAGIDLPVRLTMRR